MGSPVLEVVWSHGQGSLSVVTDDTISVLSERIMHHATCGALFVLQQSNTSVCVIYNKNNISTILPKNNDESKHNSNPSYDSKYNDTIGSIDTISSDHQSWLINTDMMVKGVACSKTAFILYNGVSVLIYRVLPAANRIEQIYTMHTTSTSMVIADTTDIIEDSIFICDDYNIKIYNLNGAIRGNITFSEVEGKPITIDINGKYLAVITNKGYMKLYDIYTPTKAKALGNGTKFYSPYNNMEIGSPTTGVSPRPTAAPTAASLTPTDRYSTTGTGTGGGGVGGGGKVVVEEEYNENICMSVDSIKVNCDGTRIAVLVSTEEGILRIRHPHSCMYIYDRLKGSILYHNFAQDSEAGGVGDAKGGGGACPRSIVFDDTDDRILTCEVEYTQGTSSSTPTNTAKPQPSDGTTSLAKAFSTTDKDTDDTKLTTTSPTSPNQNNNNSTTTIYQFFISTEHGILLQDSFTKHSTYGNLIGVSVPHIYFKTTTDISSNNSNIHDNNNSTVYDINTLKETSAGFQEVISNKVICILMRDFINMGIVDSVTKLALLDFSYNLTLGRHI